MLQKKKNISHYIIGIDEAGRGPLAGDVYVGVVALPQKLSRELLSFYRKKHSLKKSALSRSAPFPLADSKQLSETQRNEWMAWIKKHISFYVYARATSKTIDAINISQACNKAAQKGYEKVRPFLRRSCIEVIGDGGIRLSRLFYKDTYRQFSRADETVPAVSLASIVAKTSRDRAMRRLHKKYPHYGFDQHKGYGTSAHYEALKKHGPSPIHRLTFIGKSNTIKSRVGYRRKK